MKQDKGRINGTKQRSKKRCSCLLRVAPQITATSVQTAAPLILRSTHGRPSIGNSDVSVEYDQITHLWGCGSCTAALAPPWALRTQPSTLRWDDVLSALVQILLIHRQRMQSSVAL